MLNHDSELIPAAKVLDLVLSIHTPVLVMDKDSLAETVHKYPWYTLRQVRVDEITHPHGNWNNDERVLKFRAMALGTMPPIVLGVIYSSGKYELVDGMHRMLAMEMNGESIIPAFVPANL